MDIENAKDIVEIFHKLFAYGKQNITLTPDFLIEEESKYQWQSSFVFNKIAPIIEKLKTKAKSRAISDEKLFGQFGVVACLIPLQRAYNAVKNKQYEMINRTSIDSLFVEDGSVDIGSLESETLQPGKVLIYRQGAPRPTITKFDYDFTQVNMEIFKLEEQFDEMEKIFLERYCGVENE